MLAKTWQSLSIENAYKKNMSIAFGIKINLKCFSHTIFLITRTWAVRVDLYAKIHHGRVKNSTPNRYFDIIPALANTHFTTIYNILIWGFLSGIHEECVRVPSAAVTG